VIHQLLNNRTGHVLHDVAVDVAGDDGDRDNVPALVNDASNLLVFDTNNILSVNLQQIVVNQQSISSSRGVNGNGSNFSFFKLKSNVTSRALVQSQSSLKGSISDDHDNVVDIGFLQDVMNFVRGISSNIVAIYLQNLITKSESSQGSRRSLGHKTDKHSFIDGFHLETNLVVSVFTQNNLSDPM